MIDNRYFYKKNFSDFRIGDSYVFRTQDNRFDYDIRTGKFLPSGHHAGKVIVNDTIK